MVLEQLTQKLYSVNYELSLEWMDKADYMYCFKLTILF